LRIICKKQQQQKNNNNNNKKLQQKTTTTTTTKRKQAATKTKVMLLPCTQSSIFLVWFSQWVAYDIIWRIDHFTVVCSVAWPFDGREAGVNLVL